MSLGIASVCLVLAAPAASAPAATAAVPAETITAAPWSEPVLIAEGVEWRWVQFDDLFDAPLFVSVVEADVTAPSVGLEIAFRPKGEAPQPVSTLAASQHPGAAAAINATFFDVRPPFGSVCSLRVDGQTIAEPRHELSWTGNDAALVIGEDGAVRIEVRQPPEGWLSLDDAPDLITAGPVLVVDGDVVESFERHGTFCSNRHPRSAVGLTEDGTLLLVTIDGRAAESAGATCEETATIMEALGCDRAFNLDGGGSTTLWVRGDHGHEGVVNHPSDNRTFDNKGARSVTDAIVVTAGEGSEAADDE